MRVEESAELERTRHPLGRGLIAASQGLTSSFLVAMMLVMVLEVICRYALAAPLGWNIALIEKVLLPGLVFFGLPWAYAAGSHVAAELVYERLPDRVKPVIRRFGLVVTLIGLVALLVAGTTIAWVAFSHGFVPPPLSSQLAIPTWVWLTFMPLGAAMTVAVMVTDLLTQPDLAKDA